VTDWPGKFATIPWAFAEIVRHLSQVERIYLLIENRAAESRVRTILKKSGVNLEAVDFFRIPTDRGWMRDSGPIGVRGNSGEVAYNHFAFNGWAKYPNHKKDAAAVSKANQKVKRRFWQPVHKGRRVVLEGGSIDVNGRGTLLTTEECLLDARVQPRNPGLSRAEVEDALREFLGVTNILWLGRGIAGDDTHGHVDDFCRFVDPRTVVLAREMNPRDPNHRALEENRERLEGMRIEDGSKIELVRLPMPAPLFFENLRLPASYANFYIGNACVLVPTFNDPADRIALGLLGELFPDRPVVGIHAVDLVLGLGTLHCLTQQQPRAV
jgi:agmatine deiminase